ncbi:MAG: lysophospholipid acyltransferase family protein [Chloroflexales bacterium]|nr:lysophospholipid acyltransferase family protein [Chloroflexales bacterium]
MLSFINYFIIISLIEICNRLRLINWRVSGRENLPPRPQGLVLACNHVQWHDIPMIGWGLPLSHRGWWFAKVEVVDGLFGKWFTLMQVIPVKRGQRDIQAIDRAAEKVRDGAVLVVFPEGTRSFDGKLQQGRGGTARIALRAGVPIVPMAFVGNQRKFWFSKRHLIIGKPYYPTVSDTNSDKIPANEMSRLTTEIMVHIGALLPAEFYGVYTNEISEYVANSITSPVA